MSETKSGHDWSQDWQALQRQYWSAWSDLTRNHAGVDMPEAAMPWHEGLEQWARMFGTGGKQSEATERLMSSAKDYLSLMQSMLAFAAGKNGAPISAQSWLDSLRSSFNMPGLDAGLMNNPIAKALRDISGQGLRSFEQLASGATPMLAQMQQEGLSWLRAPAFGYAREHQEHYQKMALAFADFQEAAKRYTALMLQSSQRSFEILEGKLAERSEPGRQIDSVRAMYDLWVDAAEEAYAEVALSPEFRKVYGDVVNSQMLVRSQMQQEVERIGVDLGMPTRTELNSVHKRLHDLRRELRDSQEKQRAGESDGRDGEFAALRAELDDLRRLVAKGAPAKTATPVAAKSASVHPKRAAKQPQRSAPRVSKVPGPPPSPAVALEMETMDTPSKGGRAARAKPAVVKTVRGRNARRNPRARHEAAAIGKPARSARLPAASGSFGDAIAAVRHDMSRKKPKRKARVAALAAPDKVYKRSARPGRSES